MLPEAPLADSLRAIALATQVTIVFAPETVAGHRAHAMPLRGDALDMVLQALGGTGLVVNRAGAHTLVVLRAPPSARVWSVMPAPSPVVPDDIIVTALRRPTRLVDTPISILAITGTEIDRQHATGLAALASLAPSLAVTTISAGLNRLSLRGIYAAGEPTVGLYFGNTPIAGPGGSTSDPGMMTPDLALVDVERVEVLRGPQGTLFGTSSLAGTVRVLPRPPDPDRRSARVDVSGAMTAGGGGSDMVSGVINLPLVADTLALRAVVYTDHKGGVLAMPALGLAHTDWQTRNGGRLAMRWQPDQGWRVDLAGIWQRGQIGNASNSAPGARADVSQGDVLLPFEDRFWLASADLHGHLGTIMLDATLAHSQWLPHRRWDFTQAQLNHLDDGTACAAYYALGAAGCSATQMTGFDSYVTSHTPALVDQPLQVGVSSAELRLSGSGTLIWTAGGFVSRRTDTGTSQGMPVNPATGRVATGGIILSSRDFATRLDEHAAFADVSWRVNRWLGLSGGGRFFDYARTANGEVSAPSKIFGPFEVSTLSETYHAQGTVARARLEMRPSTHVLAYAQVSGGFRPGGINVVPGLSSDLRTYRDDRLESWDLGLRLLPGRGRWHVDLSAYRQFWSNMQYAAITSDGSYSFITNIGSARIDGAELSAVWQPGPHWKLHLESTLTDARLSSDQITATATTSGLRGDRLPYVAPLAASLEAQFDRPLRTDLRLTGSLLARYVGRSYSAFRDSQATPLLAMGNVVTFDGDIGLARGQGQVSLFVQNLADTHAVIWAGSTVGSNLVTDERPRSIGLTLHRAF